MKNDKLKNLAKIHIIWYIFIDMEKKLLAPSLLAADFSDLKKSISQVENGGGSVLHIDVMDGTFVPEISFGQTLVKSIRHLTSLPFDVHLMVEKPENQVESFAESGADWITFHIESCVHANRLANKIRSLGKKAGVSIVPSTPVVTISELLSEVDLVLVMSVNPGYGGQKFIPSCAEKIKQLAKIREENNLSFMISVDGGINSNTIKTVIDAGADVIVSGSSFFSGELIMPKL